MQTNILLQECINRFPVNFSQQVSSSILSELDKSLIPYELSEINLH